MSKTQSPPTDCPDVAWREIEGLIERTAAASAVAAAPSAFYGQLLEGTLAALAATGGAVWLVDEPRKWILIAEQNYPPASTGESFGETERSFLEEVAARGVPRAILPGAAIGSWVNRTDCLLLTCPVRVDGSCLAVMELFQPPEMPPNACTNALDVLIALAEAAADFHRGRELDVLRNQRAQQDRLDAFAAAVQRSLEVPTTAFTVANDGRELIGCDRVWVLAADHAACRALAVSGCDSIDRGAESVRAMERLAAAVAAVGEPVWSFGDATELPPVLESRLNDYLDVAHARQIALVPITAAGPDDANADQSLRREPVAVVAAETFTSVLAAEDFRRRMSAVCLRSGAALGHALDLQNTLGVALLRRLARSRLFAWRRRRLFWPWISAAIVIACIMLSLIPADFSVAGRGTIEPKMRRYVYAPRDAVVDEVFVAQGDTIVTGGPLFKLRDPDLDYELVRVVGEIQTTLEQLRRVRAERVRGDATGAASANDVGRLAADEETLDKRLAGLKRQQELLEAEQDALRICSPIAGQVLTWDVANQWRDRPVRQGQRLVEIANVEGEWILELVVTDHDVRHVLAARETVDANLDVSFLLATDLQTIHHGRVDAIALAAESRDGESPSVRITVRVADADPAALKAGASVVARIDCGRRSLGYVWLHEAIDAVRRYMWL
ncbi:MAG: efflux RND transporter periplasmic adaptor subunit [Pirellulales bacterium]